MQQTTNNLSLTWANLQFLIYYTAQLKVKTQFCRYKYSAIRILVFMTILLLRLPVGRGGVINSPRFCFFFFFPCRKSAHRSWVTPLCIVWATTLNSISSGICHQNTQFNMYTTTSKQQEGCTFEDSHPKCFITTNFTAKLSRGAVNRGDVHVLRASYTKVNSNTIILISFDTTDYRCYMVIVRYRSVCVQRK